MGTQRRRYDASPASIRPLLATFWSSAGWRDERQWPSTAELAAAVERGVMFSAPVDLDHDGWVEAARVAAAEVSLRDVEEAFVASLTSRRLDLRSALASYVIARGLASHPFTACVRDERCAVCGLRAEPGPVELNVLNFERFKWGGVRRADIRYIAFDLQQFAYAPRLEAQSEDVDLGRALLARLTALPPQTTATQAVPSLRLLKGNAAERANLLDILGICGVLASPEHPGYENSFVPLCERDDPSNHFVEREYPVCWWRASDGVNRDALGKVLPSLSSEGE